MTLDKELASALQLSEDYDDEEIASAIVALLTSAVYDSEPKKSMSEIYQLTTNAGATSHLDPLNILPLLLPCDDHAARDIISLIGECGPAKEVIMAVQEAAERLERSFETEDESDEDGDSNKRKDGGEETSQPKKHASRVNQLTTLIDLYASAIPRMKLRRKSAPETIKPLFEELDTILKLAGPRATRDEGRAMISSVAGLVQNVWKWVESVAADAEEDKKACRTTLKAILDRSVVACAHCIQASLAQRTFEECFPRLTFRSNLGSEWKEGDSAISELLDAYKSFGYGLQILTGPSSVSDLMVSAHRPSLDVEPDKLLPFLLPPLLSSINSNTFLDESLAVLIRTLHGWQTKVPKHHLSPDITVPLSGVLPYIASAHPDPPTRHHAFRVLSLLLSCGEPKLRFQHLVELTRDSEFPQMRVASVGLVKEGLLQAMSQSTRKDDLFLGPLFLRTFGPILFRPNPPDLFGSALSLKAFEETSEPARLVECLSLYYVLLQRDEHNLTGIRDTDVLKSIENNLLTPLRSNLDLWLDDPVVSKSHLHDITPIVSLKICLERVDAAREAFTSAPDF